MIDIHSHILPGIDDGSKNMGMTLKMLSMAEEDGTKKIVATPHYCKRFAETPYNKVKELVCDLNKIVKSENINIEIYHGQEVYYSEDIINEYREGIIGTINDTSYMLIELPMNSFDKNVFNVIYELQVQGIKVVLAHPERYHPIINEPEKINDFIKEGFLFQMNSGSLEGQFGKEVKKTCEILLGNRIYSFIGSDAHNINDRDTKISEAKRIITKEFGQNIDMFSTNGNRMLINENVNFEGEFIAKRKKRFSLFRR